MKKRLLSLCAKKLKAAPFLLFLGMNFHCCATHYPIQFSIPEKKIVQTVPKKDRDFAFINPKDIKTYIYTSEEPYYADYQRSYFGVTCKKGGWDCLRHYEILANGCIPYFVDLDQCDPNTMYFLPRELIMEAMHLPGVCYETLSIDHTIFDHAKYYEILGKLLEHTKKYLTTEKMAEYLLETTGYTGKKPILFLSGNPAPDYLPCLILTGLKQILKEKVVDVPKIDYIYTDYSQDTKKLYGKGLTYTKNIEPDNANRLNIMDQIKNRKFELVIFGQLHRGMPFYNLVLQNYSDAEIFYLCGEDDHTCNAIPHSANLFLREYSCLRKQN